MKIDILSVAPLCDRAKCAASLNEFFAGFDDRPLLTEETVCAEKFEMDGYEDALECCEEALITCVPDEALTGLKIDEHSIYELTDGGGRQFQMILREAAPGRLLVRKGNYPYGELTPGMAELACVFDRARFPDLAKLAAFGLDGLPSFHESRMEVLSREGNALRLYIRGGIFSPVNMTMTLTGITREESHLDDADDPWAYFAQEANVSDVRLYSEPDGYCVRFSGWETEAEHKNELIIRCAGLELSFEKQKERNN
ncbi:MAG: hypothetical protein FWC27_14760 [Firmicutes bacterium]|nr:hypothetical protein [Bacillota bacterium]